MDSVVFSRVVGPHDLPPGLGGYYFRLADGRVTIPVIHADHRGTGACSRFLDGIPADEDRMVWRIEFKRKA